MIVSCTLGWSSLLFLTHLLSLLETTTSSGDSHVRHSVSGQSAGGSMAYNHLVAFSSLVDGAGIAAGSAYGCAFEYGNRNPCWYGGMDIDRSIAYMKKRYRDGLIDDPNHLKTIPIVLFSGKNDNIVWTGTMKDAYEQLERLSGGRNQRVRRRFQTNATHVWSVANGTCTCGSCPWDMKDWKCCDVNNCEYSLSRDILESTYGKLDAPVDAPRDHLFWIPQAKWFKRNDNANMMTWGLLYIPSSCISNPKRCTRLHVHYHGCIKPQWYRRLRWTRSIEMNEIAESNDVLVLYPQVSGDKHSGRGCWNYGFKASDEMYDTKRSKQLLVIARMMSDVRQYIRDGCAVSVRDSPNGPPRQDACGFKPNSEAPPSRDTAFSML